MVTLLTQLSFLLKEATPAPSPATPPVALSSKIGEWWTVQVSYSMGQGDNNGFYLGLPAFALFILLFGFLLGVIEFTSIKRQVKTILSSVLVSAGLALSFTAGALFIDAIAEKWGDNLVTTTHHEAEAREAAFFKATGAKTLPHSEDRPSGIMFVEDSTGKVFQCENGKYENLKEDDGVVRYSMSYRCWPFEDKKSSPSKTSSFTVTPGSK